MGTLNQRAGYVKWLKLQGIKKQSNQDRIINYYQQNINPSLKLKKIDTKGYFIEDTKSNKSFTEFTNWFFQNKHQIYKLINDTQRRTFKIQTYR